MLTGNASACCPACREIAPLSTTSTRSNPLGRTPKPREWPTIPQLYVKGEFVGGCDILTQLHQSGDLETMLKEAKLRD